MASIVGIEIRGSVVHIGGSFLFAAKEKSFGCVIKMVKSDTYCVMVL